MLPEPGPPFSPILPILERRDDIVAAIRDHQVCIICGETGSGKTTQLPQICVSMGLARNGMIGHTQPRRLAARSVGARIAEEMGVRLGDEVGVKIRFGDQTSARTRIKVMTDGVLLAETREDRDLRRYSTLIIDEAHERSMNIDFLLGVIKATLPRRPDLKVIITSATINPGEFSRYFGGAARAPVVEVSGRMYPVEVRYLEREGGGQASGQGRGEGLSPVEDQSEAIVDAVDTLTSARMPAGDVLVFLPGEKDIRGAMTALRRANGANLELLPLYSRLTNAEQDRIFRPASSGTRRVILATNVAETSLTVPGIRYVVDSGLVRESRFDPKLRVQKLPIVWVSQASAKQRSGRCGRVSAGVCLRLYSKQEFEAFAPFTRPEVLRTNLAGVILQMRALGLGAVEDFDFVEPPDVAAISEGYATLFELGAITHANSSGELTSIGKRIASVPADPKVARMLVAAEVEGCVPEVLVLAAALSIQDPRERPMPRQREADTAHLAFFNETSDFLVLLSIWDQYAHVRDTQGQGSLFAWCRERYLSVTRMREWEQTHQQLSGLFGRETSASDTDQVEGEEDGSAGAQQTGQRSEPRRRAVTTALAASIHRALLTGLLANLCCREEGASTEVVYRGSRGNRISIFPGSVLFKRGPRWMMASELVQTTRLFARTCAKIEPQWVEELAAHVMDRTITDPHYDKETGSAAAWERVLLAGAVIVPRRRVVLADVDVAAARRIFIEQGIIRGEGKLPPAFMGANAATVQAGADAVAKLRSADVLTPEADLVRLIQARLPASIFDAATLTQWLTDGGNAGMIVPSAAERLSSHAAVALGSGAFPDSSVLSGMLVKIEYALEPGKDADGITFVAPLEALHALHAEDLQWLVPGMLEELIAACLKLLPKQSRAQLSAAAQMNGVAPESLAGSLASVLTFAEGPLASALSRAIADLFETKISEDEWPLSGRGAGLPLHLRPRIEVVDHGGREVGVGRDLAELKLRLAGRVAKARAAAARNQFRREGVLTWDFGELVEVVGEPQGPLAFPAVIDRVESVSVTLLEDAGEALASTYFGIRRLFVLACSDELGERFQAMGEWGEMARWFAPLGTQAELADSLACAVCDRVFLWNQARVTSREQFDARRDEHWGRLGQASIEVTALVARLLDARFKLAGRLAGGTPRLWATSIADIREQSAYLLPIGFLKRTRWDRLRHVSRYVEGMRERLFALREDGSGVESRALVELAPKWKRWTGWVASKMAAERASVTVEGTLRGVARSDPDRALVAVKAGAGKPGAGATGEDEGGLRARAALPNARRAAPTVNADAGDWAAQAGVLPAAVDRYRWLLEEYRLSLFAPALVQGVTVQAAAVDEAWARVVREANETAKP